MLKPKNTLNSYEPKINTLSVHRDVIEKTYITVLSTDVSGYTILCEKNAPTMVKDLIGALFSQAVRIIVQNGGCVERSFGDEVVAVFGLPVSQKDDSCRALTAATQIHNYVEAMAVRLTEKIGHRIAMHTGIASGYVVLGKNEYETCRYGITGKAIVRATQLTDMAQAGEIFADRATVSAATHNFTFEKMRDFHMDKGKIYESVYRVNGLR